MTYELAKELKHAGFRQNISGDGYFLMPDGTSQGPMNATSKFPQSVYVPRLHELIEACGDGFENLHRRKGIKAQGMYPFCANYSEDPFTGEDSWEVEGNSPEDAIARLWLALHGKTV